MASDETIGTLGIQIEADASDLPGQYDAAVSASEAAAERIASAFESVVGIGEALVITEGLKEFGEEALTAYGTVQTVTVALGQLTGSAEVAADVIGQIKDIASTEPFAFPELAPTVQRMVALGVSVEDLPKVLQAAADTAAATGNSLDAVANAIDRMALSGNAGARQLTQLGISTQQLGQIMGVSADEVKKAFTALDQSERLDVLTQALAKFSGAAVAQADTIAGRWQLLQNQWEEVMVGIGEALDPAVTAVLEFAKGVLNAAGQAIEAFNTLSPPVKEFVGAVGLAVAAIAPLTALVASAGLVFTGVGAAVEGATTLLVALGLAEATTTVETEALAAAQRDLAAAEAEVAEAPILGPLTKLGTVLSETVASSGAAAEGITLVEGAGVGAEEAVADLGVGLAGSAALMIGPVAAAVLQMKIGYDNLKKSYDDMTASVVSNMVWSAIHDGSTKSAKDLQDLGFTSEQIKTALGSLGTGGKSAMDMLEESIHAPLPTLVSLGVSLTDVQDKLKGMQVNGIPVFQILANSPDFATFKNNIEFLGGDLEKILQKLSSIAGVAPSVNAGFASMSSGLTVHIANTKAVDAATDALIKTQATLTTNLETAQAVLANVTARLKDHKASLNDVQAAQEAVDKAQKALNAGNKDYEDSLGGITESYNKQQATIATLQGTVAQLMAAQDGSAAMAEKLATAQSKLEAAYGTVVTAAQKATAATHDFVGPLTEEQAAANAAAGQLTYYGTQAEALVQKQRDLTVSVESAKGTLDALTASTDTSREHTAATIVGLENYQTALKNAGQDINALQTITINGVLYTGKLADIIKTAKDNMADFHTTSVSVAKENDEVSASVNGLMRVWKDISDVEKDNITLITGRAIPAYQTFSDLHRTLATGADAGAVALQKMATQTEQSMTNASQAIGAFNPLSASINDVGASASGTADNQSRFATQINTTSDDAGGAVDNMSRFANSIDHVGESSVTAAGKLGNLDSAITKAGTSAGKTQAAAKGAGDQFAQTAGDAEAGAQGLDVMTQSADALSTALSFLADVSSGLTVLAGSGSAHDTINSHFVSTFDQISQLQQQQAQAQTGGAALQQQLQQEIDTWFAAQQKQVTAITSNTTATTTNTTATIANTTATTDSATALASAATSVTNATTATAAVQQSFVDGLGNVYNSYQALVDAIRNNPLLAGPAMSQSGTGVAGSGPSSAPAQTFVDGMGNVYSSLQALQQALAANPGLAGPHQASGPLQNFVQGASGGSTNQIFTVGGQQVSLAQFLDSLGSTGSFSGGASAGTSPGAGFGLPSSILSNQPGVTINMHYPQFNTQQQAQQVNAQLVQMLRSIPGLKI